MKYSLSHGPPKCNSFHPQWKFSCSEPYSFLTGDKSGFATKFIGSRIRLNISLIFLSSPTFLHMEPDSNLLKSWGAFPLTSVDFGPAPYAGHCFLHHLKFPVSKGEKRTGEVKVYGRVGSGIQPFVAVSLCACGVPCTMRHCGNTIFYHIKCTLE